ncbi:hypothetical protein ebA46 [Aromatoleum aromaticum EbN1]|uniref:Uncharacterized protein n=1 Tax=Aromatoleum aromaticum (strain DSM 19018 / LMG 30748 / EbN1) TaxID=76114 RepID=Q5P964_AROAE|nr:hypothetical protein ebA46 [Aromatoleum aromaticum EbN1]
MSPPNRLRSRKTPRRPRPRLPRFPSRIGRKSLLHPRRSRGRRTTIRIRLSRRAARRIRRTDRLTPDARDAERPELAQAKAFLASR